MIIDDKTVYINGVVFITNYQPTFWNWCAKKGLVIKDIEKFHPKDKMKIILRWKWFTEDDTSAKECEETRRETLRRFKQLPPITDSDKHWLKNALYIESHTNEIKAYFGLISQAEYETLEKVSENRLPSISESEYKAMEGSHENRN